MRESRSTIPDLRDLGNDLDPGARRRHGDVGPEQPAIEHTDTAALMDYVARLGSCDQWALVAFARRRTITTIGVTIKLVDARTGEVVATAVGNGRGSRTARKLGLLGLALPFGGGGSRSSQARDAMVDEAVRQAVHLAASDLVRFAPRLTTAEAVR